LKINEKLLITNYIDPDVRFESQYGFVDGETWVKREKVRMGGCEIVRDDIGFMALLRKKPGAEKNYEEQHKSVRWVKKFGKSR